MYNLYSTSLAVYTIAIKTSTGKRLYSGFNLCSSGLLSDSTHIRSIISISFREDHHRSSYLAVISTVMTSHENALLANGRVLIGQPLNIRARSAACAWLHAVDHAKFKTKKIYSQGILVNYTKICTNDNFPLYGTYSSAAFSLQQPRMH